MSMDNPNEYEQAIEVYAQAVRDEDSARIAVNDAVKAHTLAQSDRQEKWRVVGAFVAEGKIKPGIYRLSLRNESYACGVLIQRHHDYPEVFEMYR